MIANMVSKENTKRRAFEVSAAGAAVSGGSAQPIELFHPTKEPAKITQACAAKRCTRSLDDDWTGKLCVKMAL